MSDLLKRQAEHFCEKRANAYLYYRQKFDENGSTVAVSNNNNNGECGDSSDDKVINHVGGTSSPSSFKVISPSQSKTLTDLHKHMLEVIGADLQLGEQMVRLQESIISLNSVTTEAMKASLLGAAGDYDESPQGSLNRSIRRGETTNRRGAAAVGVHAMHIYANGTYYDPGGSSACPINGGPEHVTMTHVEVSNTGRSPVNLNPALRPRHDPSPQDNLVHVVTSVSPDQTDSNNISFAQSFHDDHLVANESNDSGVQMIPNVNDDSLLRGQYPGSVACNTFRNYSNAEALSIQSANAASVVSGDSAIGSLHTHTNSEVSSLYYEAAAGGSTTHDDFVTPKVARATSYLKALDTKDPYYTRKISNDLMRDYHITGGGGKGGEVFSPETASTAESQTKGAIKIPETLRDKLKTAKIIAHADPVPFKSDEEQNQEELNTSRGRKINVIKFDKLDVRNHERIGKIVDRNHNMNDVAGRDVSPNSALDVYNDISLCNTIRNVSKLEFDLDAEKSPNESKNSHKDRSRMSDNTNGDDRELLTTADAAPKMVKRFSLPKIEINKDLLHVKETLPRSHTSRSISNTAGPDAAASDEQVAIFV